MGPALLSFVRCIVPTFTVVNGPTGGLKAYRLWGSGA